MQKTLYPKTKRISDSNIIITEKLDGSNLWIFKLNWEIIIAQRNNVLKLSELNSKQCYKWLYQRIHENTLDIYEWSWVFGERIWMWAIKYNFDKRFYIFAKARISEDYEVSLIQYENLQYAFNDQIIPDCIWLVPVVQEITINPTISYLDTLYDIYKEKVWRNVEWFIINNQWNIIKYVRYKDWKLTEHYS